MRTPMLPFGLRYDRSAARLSKANPAALIVSPRTATVIFDCGVCAFVQLYVVVTWRAALPRTISPTALAEPCRLNRSIEPVTVPEARSEPASTLRGIARGVSTCRRIGG